MTTFVLVHGAFVGGWFYKRTARILRHAGHRVHRPTLTGLGERSHLMSPAVDLETHIQDILNLFRWEELSDVVLCGDSYGGMVITGVADRIPEKIRSLVYLHGFVPEDGQSVFDLMGETAAEAQRSAAREHGDGQGIPMAAAGADRSGDPKLTDWVRSLAVPHPLASFEQKLRLSGRGDQIRRRYYILATNWAGKAHFGKIAEKLAKDPSWRVREVSCGQLVPVEAPGDMAELLVAAG